MFTKRGEKNKRNCFGLNSVRFIGDIRETAWKLSEMPKM